MLCVCAYADRDPEILNSSTKANFCLEVVFLTFYTHTNVIAINVLARRKNFHSSLEGKCCSATHNEKVSKHISKSG